jgi:thiamine biosynthesis protein ThiI
MPLGTQSRVVGLLSGGIDSAVACWLVMKRGCPVVPVYFDNTPFTNETTTERALNVAEALFNWAVGFPRKVYVVQHGENLKKIIEDSSRKFTCLLCKRAMYRIAERLADMIGVEGIVSGEAIGEQASQTLTNLRVLSNAVQKHPIHRPLLGFDKAETEAIARKIGTYEISSRKAGRCTAVPSKPATKAKLEEVMNAEQKLNIEEMVERSIESTKVVKV